MCWQESCLSKIKIYLYSGVFRHILADGANSPKCYHEWVQRTNFFKNTFQKVGVTVVGRSRGASVVEREEGQCLAFKLVCAWESLVREKVIPARLQTSAYGLSASISRPGFAHLGNLRVSSCAGNGMEFLCLTVKWLYLWPLFTEAPLP